MKKSTQFRCPACYSSHFGSESDESDGKFNVVSRQCHGYPIKEGVPVPCDFTWPYEDDWKHFRQIVTFESHEEFVEETHDDTVLVAQETPDLKPASDPG